MPVVRLAIVASCLVALAGCAGSVPPADSRPAEVSASDEDLQVARLIREMGAIKGEKIIAEARLAEQLRRESRLSDEVNRLRFLTDRQDSQIKALANAARQRDELQERCSLLEERIASLTGRLAELSPPADPAGRAGAPSAPAGDDGAAPPALSAKAD
jgi:hypothetical protein